MSVGGFLPQVSTVRGPTVHPQKVDSWAPGPNCPGPNCPGPNSPGPNCPGPNLPRTRLLCSSHPQNCFLARFQIYWEAIWNVFVFWGLCPTKKFSWFRSFPTLDHFSLFKIINKQEKILMASITVGDLFMDVLDIFWDMVLRPGWEQTADNMYPSNLVQVCGERTHNCNCESYINPGQCS